MAISRVREREQVFCLLFSAEFQASESDEEILSAACEAQEWREDAFDGYVKDTFSGARAFSDEAMALVAEVSKGWSAARMSPAMRSLLKLSVYEILKTDIPVKIAVNEAVELCKRYEDLRGAKFLNGVLGTISRTYAKEKCEE